jgi:FSR family fosmidomycin resistance protein-like MFS transporter
MMVIGVLRTLPAVGVPLALAFLIKQRGGSNEQIGAAQSVFLGGIGAGSLACALFVRRARERTVLWVLPVLSAPPLLACPATGFAGMVAGAAAVGALLGAVMPILIGYGQRLLHDGPRVASSLTMGVTWGVGGLGVAVLLGALNHARRPDLAFPAFAAAALASSALCAWLPEPDGRLTAGAPAPATSET